MKKTIYKELIIIFITVLLFSNIITAYFVSQTFENTTISDMKDILMNSVDEAKGIYTEYNISQRDLDYLFRDKTIPIIFTDNVEEYKLTDEQISRLNNGDSILIDTMDSNVHEFPVAITKVDNTYIVSDIGGHSIFIQVREIVSLNSTIAIVLGSMIFMVVGKMIIEPIKEITDATKKVATGDFKVELVNNRKDELGDLIESFNKMTKDLGSIEILRNDFISDISHEFKTPITSIEGYTKLLVDCKDDNRDEYIEIILRETSRLSTMATNILTLNKLDNEGIYSNESFRLDEQIRKSILLLENKWCKKNLELDVELDELIFNGNKGLINQIWINLIDNAVKFSPQKGTIKISLIDYIDKCEFIIEDQGMGIKTEDQKRVFDKFYKSDKSRNTEGTGLGLSIVKRIVDLHDGIIELTSEVGKGTRIRIVLKKNI